MITGRTITSAVCVIAVAFSVVACGRQTTDYVSTESEPAYDFAAQVAVDRAKGALGIAEAATLRHGDCSSSAMSAAMAGLQPAERAGDSYVKLALATSDLSERGAALNVSESLYGTSIDGYLALAGRYATAGCTDRARWIYSEIIRVYSGAAFASANAEARQKRLALISAGSR
jgi:hypothetical protein